MLYRDIVELLAEEYGDSSLNKWITDCGRDIITKIVAFNLFCEIHFENLQRDDLKENIKILEEHIRARRNLDPNLDIIECTKCLINSNFPHLWESRETELDHIDRISTVIPAEILKQSISPFNGKSIKRTNYQLFHRESVKRLIEEFKRIQEKNGDKIRFHGRYNIVWFTLSSDLDDVINGREESSELASQIMNLLGLLVEEIYLVEIQYKPYPANPGHVPTVFHSDFKAVFLPHYSDNGWGITLDLEDLKAGCKESVQKGSLWPMFDYRLLGMTSLRPKIQPEEWERYLKRRIEDFKNWASEREEILTDLEYFLDKWGDD